MPFLPQELIDEIIDNIAQEHSRTLRACSLVARSWLPRASYHIHKNIVVGTSKVSYFAPRYRDPNLRFYLEYPHLVGHARSLHVIHTTDQLGFLPFCFPRLEKLSFTLITWNRITPAARTFVLSHVSSVTALHLFNVGFTSFKDFAILISSFPRLSELIIDYMDILQAHSPADDDQLPQITLRLDELDISESAMHNTQISRFFNIQKVRPQIRRLRVKRSRFDDLCSLREWCQIAGASLHYLEFDSGLESGGQIYNDQLYCLQYSTQLRTLDIKAFSLRECSMLWIPVFLSHIKSTHLNRITIHVDFAQLDCLTTQVLGNIDITLNRDNKCTSSGPLQPWARSLKTIEFVLQYDVSQYKDFSRISDWIEVRMPKAVTKGRLKSYSLSQYRASYKDTLR
ncbi:hypothetical protein C8Q75DRAFT_803553 [Abortiporus biennis]|nr:hypothetical protein C8Q75DRAFT_803553 [Abortiporus biennis]